VIVCVGDSVTAAGVYEGFLQAMLDCLYPGAGRVRGEGQRRFGTPQFWLTSQPGLGQESMSFIQLGERDEGVLYRIGY